MFIPPPVIPTSGVAPGYLDAYTGFWYGSGRWGSGTLDQVPTFAGNAARPLLGSDRVDGKWPHPFRIRQIEGVQFWFHPDSGSYVLRVPVAATTALNRVLRAQPDFMLIRTDPDCGCGSAGACGCAQFRVSLWQQTGDANYAPVDVERSFEGAELDDVESWKRYWSALPQNFREAWSDAWGTVADRTVFKDVADDVAEFGSDLKDAALPIGIAGVALALVVGLVLLR